MNLSQPMLGRRRQTKKLLRVARMLRELESASRGRPTSQRVERVAVGRVA